MRIKTSDEAEFRFWLTRRYVKLLCPIVLKMLSADQQIARQEDPSAKSAVLSFQHEEALQMSDFSTRFNEASSRLPLGETPVLLAKIQLKRRPDGTSILCMHPEHGEGIELSMNKMLLHSFTKLLADAIAAAGWGIEFRIAEKNPTPEGASRRMN